MNDVGTWLLRPPPEPCEIVPRVPNWMLPVPNGPLMLVGALVGPVKFVFAAIWMRPVRINVLPENVDVLIPLAFEVSRRMLPAVLAPIWSVPKPVIGPVTSRVPPMLFAVEAASSEREGATPANPDG